MISIQMVLLRMNEVRTGSKKVGKTMNGGTSPGSLSSDFWDDPPRPLLRFDRWPALSYSNPAPMCSMVLVLVYCRR